ncbi:hypothetical protein GGR57DRAFT_245902 [Xylariaceae sp. FL1272]|nr:hypothetical protein GGR57DRAFT_245902 [Xylariaceae sp. FL1272]
MSRSIDKNLVAQLKAEDPRPAYDSLSKLLTTLPDSGLLEIEFLGYSHQLEPGIFYLQDENAVAISKLTLLQAFSIARSVLQKHLDSGNLPLSDVMATTAIILLMDPEHLTAANTRKRALLSDGVPTLTTLTQEKQFVDTLLTARLHRHTKSPTLWSHRRWLFGESRKVGYQWDVQQDIKDVIMIAAERHPRNYVAWQHARLLVNADRSTATLIAADVKDFCLKNHSDISGWTFLSFCISQIDSRETRQKVYSSVLADVLSLTDSFRWTNESVWVFLRTTVSAKLVNDEQRNQFYKTLDKLSAGSSQTSPQWGILGNTRKWCHEYGP